MKLILASQSPRRAKLLKQAGFDFEICPSHCEEVFDFSLPLELAIQEVAYQKARDIQKQYPECIILGADTIVVFEGQLLGKPKDEQEARDILQKLSGHSHEVKTGVCILYPDHKVSFCETTRVVFRTLSKEDIDSYIQKGTYIDKAGSYGIQECDFVKEIQGSYDNVVGLPIKRLQNELLKGDAQ